jgi:hypothetical protein
LTDRTVTPSLPSPDSNKARNYIFQSSSFSLSKLYFYELMQRTIAATACQMERWQDLKLAAVLLDELGLEVVIKVRCIFKLVPKKLLIEMCPDWRLQHLGVAETNYVYTSGLISFCTIA